MPEDGSGDGSSNHVDAITNLDQLRDRKDVPFHEEMNIVEDGVVEQVTDTPDLAAVGITNPEGDTLLRRLTDTCSWKLPVEAVGQGEDFAVAIIEHVRETVGFALSLDAIEGAWHLRYRTENGAKSASQAIVVFSGTPASDSYDIAAATPEGEPVAEIGWFGELPENSQEIPGTALFVGSTGGTGAGP